MSDVLLVTTTSLERRWSYILTCRKEEILTFGLYTRNFLKIYILQKNYGKL
jgi:hypothetical protein